MSETSYNPTELLICTASRLMEDGSTAFIGTGIPMLAAALAQRRQAPNLVPVFEFGGTGAILEDLPLAVGEARTFHKAVAASGITDVMEAAQRGFIDYGFLGGAQVDPYGNLNSTIIGPQHHPPKVRLPGSGGAPEMAVHCREIFIVMPQSRRGFVERLDFLTTLGHGEGGTGRRDLGLTSKGPTRIITDLCVMEPDTVTRELTVTSLHPGITAGQVRGATGWPVRFAGQVAETPPPTSDDLRVLRDLLRRTAEAHGTRLPEG